MPLTTAIPRPPLAEFVDLLWLHEDGGQPHPRERLLPDGSAELVINLRDEPLLVYQRPDTRADSFRDALLCGPHDRAFAIDTAAPTAVFGVHFKPGGAFPFFRAPADALRGLHLSLDDLWGRAAAELRERLLAAAQSSGRSPAAMFAIAERTLLAQLARPLERHPAVAWALRAFQRQPIAATIGAVVEAIGISQRHFIARFSAEVGLTPKRFCRVQRFQSALRAIERGRPVAWADLALDCGYYDQAHLARDFQAFAGLSPTAYLSLRSDHFNHVPIKIG